jgi:hypothetical protein
LDVSHFSFDNAKWKSILTLKMVYYFTSSVVSPAAHIYVGKDKVESMLRLLECWDKGRLNADLILDEELIKYGLEEDVW